MGNDKMIKEMKCHVNDEFYFFLNWLADEKSFSAKEIAEVTRYYWKYEKQWKQYLEEVSNAVECY
tara:strand:+ start:1099 stop:1293 length:195 start_codon:yes stop_codon:yes gene_type:complete